MMTEQLEGLTMEQQEGQDTEIQDIAEEIALALQEAFDILIERRDSAYAAAIKLT
ncbi:MAG TPA: hypothetical protein VMW54_14695 [Terriglobia bacterium]|nr:hypothetical protein [Terriglobia bacterium]